MFAFVAFDLAFLY